MGAKHLYRISIISDERWRKKMKPIYVVEESAEKAADYASHYIRPPYKAGKASRLGSQCSGIMFSGNS